MSPPYSFGSNTRTNPAGAAAGSEGQNYLATVSDLISAFIFVFIVMLAIFAYRLATATEEVRGLQEVRDSVLVQTRRRLKDSGMQVEMLRDQGVLRLSENAVNFPLGADSPVARHRVNVGIVARAIAEVVPCYVATMEPERGQPEEFQRPPYCGVPVDRSSLDCGPEGRENSWLIETLLIEGHTDSVPVAPGRPYRSNLELASMRAATVHGMIAACEAGVEHLTNSHGHPILSTSGYGEARPATPDPERRDLNRRIDLRFLLEPPPDLFRRGESAVETEVREAIGERRR